MEVLGGWRVALRAGRVRLHGRRPTSPAPEAAARDEAERRGWAFERIEGSMVLLRRLIDGDWGDDMLVLQPGERLAMSYDDGGREGGPRRLSDRHRRALAFARRLPLGRARGGPRGRPARTRRRTGRGRGACPPPAGSPPRRGPPRRPAARSDATGSMIPLSMPASAHRSMKVSLSSLRAGIPNETLDRPPVRWIASPYSAAEPAGRLDDVDRGLGRDRDGQDERVDVEQVRGRSARASATSMRRIAFATRSSALAGMPPRPLAARMTAQAASAARSRTSGRSIDAELSRSRPRGWVGGGDARREHRDVRGVDRDRHGGRRLDRRDQPGHGLGAHPGVRGDLVHVEVEPVGAGDLLAVGEGPDVGGRGVGLGAVVQAVADRALDVLDLAGGEVARRGEVRVDREHEALARRASRTRCRPSRPRARPRACRPA